MITLGSQQLARTVFERMLDGSAAYRETIEKALHSIDQTAIRAIAWHEIPILTKKNFYGCHSWREIIPQELYRDIYFVLRCSGMTANGSRGFFWPQLKSADLQAGPVLASMLNANFNFKERPTLAIIGMSLGSWAGGEQFAFTFKSLALHSDAKLVVFSPGNQHAEILEILEECSSEFKQIIIALCPSAIFYLLELANQRGFKLPLEKVTFLVTGEPFAEELRIQLQNRCGRSSSNPIIISVYGSADTGILGIESPELITLRQFLATSPGAAASCGLGLQSVPNLYHFTAQDTYAELVNGELVLTKWQGLPLVRYNLEDRVEIISWKETCSAVAAVDQGDNAPWKEFAARPLPDLMVVRGRSKGCLFLCGSNIFDSMLQQCLLSTSQNNLFTGAFVAWTEIQNGRQVLSWQVELTPGTKESDINIETLYNEMVTALSTVQPEFTDDYEKFYRPLEKSGLRIFSFRFAESPHLSNHPQYGSGVKRKIIIEHGPLL